MSGEASELVSLAQRLRQQGRFADARVSAERALEVEPDNAAAWFNLGAALSGLRRLEDAEAAYRRALQRNPQYAEAWSNLGGVLGARGAIEEQLAAYQKAIDSNPLLAPVWSNFGSALCNARRHDEAESASRRAVELDASFVPGWLNLARVLNEQKRWAEAGAASRRALELAPDMADAWAALGNSLMGLRQFADAIHAYQKAASMQPQRSDFQVNLAMALKWMRLDAEGDVCLRKALELDPTNDAASCYLAFSLLDRGELAEGWMRYEGRWARPDSPPRRYAPKGTVPLSGGRVLLWGEQGVGDQILYSRMAAEAARTGAEITLETDPRLAALFRRSFPDLEVVAGADPPQIDPASFDHVLPLGSLGGWLRASFGAFPRERRYLLADAARSRRYRQILEQMLPRNSLIVGIAWRSSNRELAYEKSAPLREWRPLLTLKGISFVILQYGDFDEECAEAARAFGATIARLPGLNLFRDLDGLAALHDACDLVITTSVVNAHFSGALGQSAWVLLPKRTGKLWYWFRERSDSPWYPALTLIRQSTDGDWTSVMETAAERLRHMAAERR